jgi:hypothetical protein
MMLKASIFVLAGLYFLVIAIIVHRLSHGHKSIWSSLRAPDPLGNIGFSLRLFGFIMSAQHRTLNDSVVTCAVFVARGMGSAVLAVFLLVFVLSHK